MPEICDFWGEYHCSQAKGDTNTEVLGVLFRRQTIPFVRKKTQQKVIVPLNTLIYCCLKSHYSICYFIVLHYNCNIGICEINTLLRLSNSLSGNASHREKIITKLKQLCWNLMFMPACFLGPFAKQITFHPLLQATKSCSGQTPHMTS